MAKGPRHPDLYSGPQQRTTFFTFLSEGQKKKGRWEGTEGVLLFDLKIIKAQDWFSKGRGRPTPQQPRALSHRASKVHSTAGCKVHNKAEPATWSIPRTLQAGHTAKWQEGLLALQLFLCDYCGQGWGGEGETARLGSRALVVQGNATCATQSGIMRLSS